MRGGAVIGVTGLPCAGKSLAAELIASGEICGTPGELLKADEVGHAVLELPDVREELRRFFGEGIFRCPEPGAVRKAIAARVFDDPAALAWLERLVHPAVFREIERLLSTGSGGTMARARMTGPVVIESALLFAGKLDRLCDAIVTVEAPFEIRVGRAAGRGWSRDELERRERRLAPLFGCENPAFREGRAVVVVNDGDETQLRDRLKLKLNAL